MLTCTIFWFVFTVPVLAVTIEELPVITRWESGKGYDEDGNCLADTWAFDSVHEAGRYVLFGKMEKYCKKQKSGKRKNR